MEYRESQSSLPLNGLLLGSMAAAAVGAWIAVDSELGVNGAIALGAAVPILLVVILVFRSLRLVIDASGISASWGGILNRRHPWADIDRVEASRYRWLPFGGWGLRWDGRGGTAYSQLGVKDQLVLYLKNGKRLHVTVKNAKAALEALREHQP
ncbi:MAG: hypothetical protein IPK87_15175 [Planctomycetes bacterium]|nr:hypothetical protein [Planctomycetota bacterium]